MRMYHNTAVSLERLFQTFSQARVTPLFNLQKIFFVRNIYTAAGAKGGGGGEAESMHRLDCCWPRKVDVYVDNVRSMF